MHQAAASTWAPARADAQLHGLEVAHAHAGVVGAALLDGRDRELERGLGVADAAAGQTVRAERGQRHPDTCGLGLSARARELAAAAVPVHATARDARERKRPWRARLAAGAAHAEHLPVVDDLVVAARHQAHAVIDDALAVAHGHRQHVPGGWIDAAREVPEAADARSRRRPRGRCPGGTRCRRRSARPDPGPRSLPGPARRTAPASSDGCERLATFQAVEAQPRATSTGTSKIADERQLHAAPALGLVEAEEARAGAGRPAFPSPSGGGLGAAARSRRVGTSPRARRIASS